MFTDSPVDPKQPVRLALIYVPEVSVAVLLSLKEVFEAVGSTWQELTGQQAVARRFEVSIVARPAGLERPVGGIAITADHDFSSEYAPDVIIAPDLQLQEEIEWSEEQAWLRRQKSRGAIICSVCTGTLMLASAGILDGLQATTHWSAAKKLAELHPEVDVRLENIILPAGEGHTIITSGGSASWADLTLYLVARYSGAAEARRIAKIFILGDRSDGQLPFASLALPRQHDDRIISRAQQWIAMHYDCANPVAEMTRQSGLNERTFKRRFCQSTGYRPIEYVQALRIEEAKQSLETTPAPIEDIAAEVGYQDVGAFRRLFKKLTGLKPSEYKNRFADIGKPS